MISFAGVTEFWASQRTAVSTSVFKHTLNLPDNEAATAGLIMISRAFIDIILILGFVGAQEDYTHLLGASA